MNNDIKEKDIEIFELKNQIKKLENRLKEENEEKSKDEEYNKYKINKIKMQYNEEIKLLNSKNENLINELKNLKNNEQKNINEFKIKELTKKIEFLRNENNVKKEEIDECKININKTNNENINEIKNFFEKIE